MLSFFLILFVICLLINYVREGGSFVAFSRMVEVANSIREDTPRDAKSMNNLMAIEYKVGRRSYTILIPQMSPLRWVAAAANYGDDKWYDVTGKIEHFSGLFRNFHGLPIKPSDIDPEFVKLGFRFETNDVVHVGRDEIIIPKLKAGLKACAAKQAKKSAVIKSNTKPN